MPSQRYGRGGEENNNYPYWKSNPACQRTYLNYTDYVNFQCMLSVPHLIYSQPGALKGTKSSDTHISRWPFMAQAVSRRPLIIHIRVEFRDILCRIRGDKVTL
jgi:hypothetical protein